MKRVCWARIESKCCLGVSPCVDALMVLMICSFKQVQKHAVSKYNKHKSNAGNDINDKIILILVI